MVDFGGIASSIINWILYLLIAGVVIGLIIFMLNLAKYKHRVIVKILGKHGKIIVTDKAKEVKQKGRKYWRLLKLKENIPIPPESAFQITNKGKVFVEAYKTPQGEFIYVDDDTNIKSEDIIKNPLQSSDIEFYVSQQELSNQYKTNTWKDLIPQLLPYMFFIVFMVIIFAFWGQIMQPAKDMTTNLARSFEQSSKVMEEQRRTQELINAIWFNDTTLINDTLPTPPPDLPSVPN